MWLQLSLVTDAEHLQRVEEALMEAGAAAVTLSGEDGQIVVESSPDGAPSCSKIRVSGLFDAGADMERVRALLRSVIGEPSLQDCQVEPLEDRDWGRAWMDHFHPVRFGERLWVCPGWLDPPDPSAVNIFLDPGQAFGTGAHPTTALCLEWLEGADLRGLEVIDYGCGSGILAIAAAKLGARHVWAVDNDPQALIAAQENVRRNGVGMQVSIGTPETPPLNPLPQGEGKTDHLPPPLMGGGKGEGEKKVDIILANILARPLIALAPHFAGLTRPGGAVILSGILTEQVEEAVRAYEPWFDIVSCVSRDNWVRLEGRRKRWRVGHAAIEV